MNVLGVLLLVLLIGATLVCAEWAARTGKIRQVLARKWVHLVAVSSLAFSPLLIYKAPFMYGVIGGFALLLFWVVATRRLTIDKGGRRSWGIALFPVAYLLLYACFQAHTPWLVAYPMLILAFADALAAWMGETRAKQYFNLTGDRKSWWGSLSFACFTLVLLSLLPMAFAGAYPPFGAPMWALAADGWALIGLVTIMLTLAEALGSGGTDNLWVPLLGGWLLLVLQNENAIWQGWLGLGLAAGLACLAWRRGWLNAGAACTVVVMGTIVWLAGGWRASIPISLFFVAGTLLGRLPRKNAPSDAKHGRPRDYKQVLANGGIAMLMLMASQVWPEFPFTFLYMVSVAISMADTASSEVGQWVGGATWNMLTGRSMPVGRSGGISVAGTLGGLMGAAAIALAGWAMHLLTGAEAGWVTLAGVLGMLADSALGSGLQGAWHTRQGQYLEQPHLPDDVLVKGFRWLDNDGVNALSNAFITLLVAVAIAIARLQ